MTEEKDYSRQETEEKDQSRREIEKMDMSKQEIEETDQNRQKELNDDSLELMLEEQSRSQVRSDYRRSLGNEYGRRYME
jgi:hypothetical protein